MLQNMQKAKFWASFTRFTDDFSCMSFTVSILITFQFWMLHLVTGGMVERSEDRPEWLGFTVHVVNACLAVGDVLLSNPRSFSPRAMKMLYGYSLSYACFIGVCRHALCKQLGYLMSCTCMFRFDECTVWIASRQLRAPCRMAELPDGLPRVTLPCSVKCCHLIVLHCVLCS
jgi:hypothetical protein